MGGAINSVALQNFADAYYTVYLELSSEFQRPALFWEILPHAALPLIIVLSAPILLSLILTKFHPEKQIVPPLYLQILSFAWFLVYLYNRPHYFNFGSLFVLSFYTALGGLLHDKIAIGILGHVTTKEDILVFSFKTETNVPQLQSILTMDKIRENLYLSKKTEKRNQSVLLRSPNDQQYQTVIELSETPEKGKSLMNVAIFEKGRYALKRT